MGQILFPFQMFVRYLIGDLKCFYVNVCWNYLHPLFTAAEQASVSELQGFFGSGTLLPFIL